MQTLLSGNISDINYPSGNEMFGQVHVEFHKDFDLNLEPIPDIQSNLPPNFELCPVCQKNYVQANQLRCQACSSHSYW